MQQAGLQLAPLFLNAHASHSPGAHLKGRTGKGTSAAKLRSTHYNTWSRPCRSHRPCDSSGGLQLLPPPCPVWRSLGHSMPSSSSTKYRGCSLCSKPRSSTTKQTLLLICKAEPSCFICSSTPHTMTQAHLWLMVMSPPRARTFPEGLLASTHSSRSRSPRWPFTFCSRACRSTLFLYEETGGSLGFSYIP